MQASPFLFYFGKLSFNGQRSGSSDSLICSLRTQLQCESSQFIVDQKKSIKRKREKSHTCGHRLTAKFRPRDYVSERASSHVYSFLQRAMLIPSLSVIADHTMNTNRGSMTIFFFFFLSSEIIKSIQPSKAYSMASRDIIAF